MKTGIMTFHNALNYGALLQTYAFQQILINLGCETYILNYINENIVTLNLKPSISNYRNYVKYFNDLSVYQFANIRSEKFEDFLNKYLNLTSLINSDELSNHAKSYDILFCGSDQVWNDSITCYDDHYYLDFVPSEKKCSYAASIGKNCFSNNELSRIRRLLSSFRAISVRENTVKNALCNQMGIFADCVLDPSLLLDKDDYENLIKKSYLNIDVPYIFVYMLVYSKTLLESAKRLSSEIGIPIYIVNTSGKNKKSKYNYSDSGIEDWLYLLKNASYVITNSFHGVAFSINFKKVFFVELLPARVNANSRLLDFLSLLELKERIVSEGQIGNKIIDYSEVNIILKREKSKSLDFIKKALKGEFVPEKQKTEQSILRIPFDHCSGCSLCAQVCPVNAIKMQTDKNGFYHPVVCYEKCNQCGRCFNMCPFHNFEKIKHTKKPLEIYAAYSETPRVVQKSSSGGIFYELATSILSLEGHIYGAAFTKDFNLIHKCVNNKDKLAPLMGSKYVQSCMDNTLKSILDDLNRNIPVLFVGTPCQSAAVKTFCNGVDNNLWVCDFICHGVPSPKLLKEHITYCEKYFGSTVADYIPRSKVEGWKHNEMLNFTNGKTEYLHPVSQAFKNIFYANCGIHYSCFNCPFTTFDRVSDLTLADYWGIENKRPELFRPDGVSMILVNSEKGRSLLKKVKTIHYDSTELNTISENKQPHLFRPISGQKKSEKFWKIYNTYGWEYVISKYAGCGRKSLFKWRIKKIIKKNKILGIFLKKGRSK